MYKSTAYSVYKQQFTVKLLTFEFATATHNSFPKFSGSVTGTPITLVNTGK